jgi:hypothetical protein
VDHVLYTHWLAGQVGSSTSPTAVRYGPVLFRAKAVSFAEAAAVKGDAEATRDLYETKQKSWTETADKIKDEDPDAYAYLTGERTNRTGEALPALAGTYTLAFPMFAFALMMAGYLVIRFVVMTAPVWATVATVPQTQGILRSAAPVATVAIVHPVIMAVGASVSVLTTGYLLDPGTGLGWLGLLLSVLFTAMMQVVLKRYGRLRGLVTGEPVETPRQALNRLRAQAAGLARGAAGAVTGAPAAVTTAATATGAAPTGTDPTPRPGTVAVRFTRSDHTPAWAREDHGGGPEWTPTTSPTQRGTNDLTVPAWARDHDENEHVWLPPDRPTPNRAPTRDHVRPESIYQKGLLHEHLRQLQKYGEAGFSVLEDNRFRYVGFPDPADHPGGPSRRDARPPTRPGVGPA